MRLIFWVFGLLAFVTVVSAWTKEDHEIFDLAASVEASEGKGTTFYSWLDVPSTASTAEIGKAYRRKSVKLHPDKNPGIKNAHERFARLGVVATILRNSEGRERYDFFYKNGFPKWKGTGYYYSRFRPGVVSVLIFLVILTSGLQYIVQSMNYKRDVARIDRFVGEARTAAWGTKGIPLEGKRKVKVNVGGPPRLDGDGNYMPGRVIDMVVDGQDVFILESDGSLVPLDSDVATEPAISRTWFITLVTSTASKYLSPYINRSTSTSPPETNTNTEVNGIEEDSEADDTASTGGEVSEASKSGPMKKPAAVTKAGGRRRKAVKKR